VRDPVEIFVRAHTAGAAKSEWTPPKVPKWPREVLVFDTETTCDTVQKLNFGAYRRCKLSPSGYQCVEEGLFYADDLRKSKVNVLRRYVDDPKNVPDTEVKAFPPQMRLKLYSRWQFVERVFWKSIQRNGMIISFNLPFDLSRIAVTPTEAKGGGWSLVLSTHKNKKTGQIEPNPYRPRVIIESLDSKLAFISLRDILLKDEWPYEGRFLDLHTFGRALRDVSLGLHRMCKTFKTEGKMKDHKPTGDVNPAEIAYCRQDVKATAKLLNKMKEEFDRHPIDLTPDKAYSPASIAKAYLDAMGIEIPKRKFNLSDRDLGIAMQGYYGGRAECRIRKLRSPSSKPTSLANTQP